MREKRLWIPALLLVAVFALIFGLLLRRDRAREDRLTALQREAAPLELRRSELTHQQKELEREYAGKLRGTATAELLFLSLDEKLLDAALPLMEEHGIVGMLVLSEGELPGQPGRISRETYDALLEQGWLAVAGCAERGDLAAWKARFDAMLEEQELSCAPVLYLADGCYRPEKDELLAELGYSVVLHHGEEQTERLIVGAGEGLWLPGAQPWNYNGIKADLEQMIDLGGNLCFTVSLHGDLDGFDRQPFENMLDYLQEQQEDGALRVTDLLQARSQQFAASLSGEPIRRELAEKLAELDKEIAELDRQIAEIYQSGEAGA